MEVDVEVLLRLVIWDWMSRPISAAYFLRVLSFVSSTRTVASSVSTWYLCSCLSVSSRILIFLVSDWCLTRRIYSSLLRLRISVCISLILLFNE